MRSFLVSSKSRAKSRAMIGLGELILSRQSMLALQRLLREHNRLLLIRGFSGVRAAKAIRLRS